VSGGGYIGSCLSSLYADGKAEFPLEHEAGVAEAASLRHLRNFSSYLAPRGFMDLLWVPALMLRGLLANLLVLVPYIILAAMVTVFFSGETIATAVRQNVEIPTFVETVAPGASAPDAGRVNPKFVLLDRRDGFRASSLTKMLERWKFTGPIVVAGIPLGAVVTGEGAIKLGPGIWRVLAGKAESYELKLPRSAPKRFEITVRQASTDRRDPAGPRVAVWSWEKSFSTTGLLAVLVLATLALYPLAQTTIHRFTWTSWALRERAIRLLALAMCTTGLVAVVELQPFAVYHYAKLWLEVSTGQGVPRADLWTGFLTAVAALAGVLSGPLAKHSHRLIARLGLYVIGAMGPLALCFIYLMIARWAICGPPWWLFGLLSWMVDGPGPANVCYGPLGEAQPIGMYDMLLVYGVLFVATFLYAHLFIDVNRTSLHTYYRDKLSKAYLFRRPAPLDPPTDGDTAIDGTELASNDKQSLEGLSSFVRFRSGRWTWMRFISRWATGTSALSTDATPTIAAPYHLVNAAVNIQKANKRLRRRNAETAASRSSDLRGRKADYFLFSPRFVGSRLSGYCATEEMHGADPHVDLGTAMAVSGAAASPNMGTSTIRALVFIMTMLNVRLGYWLPNPRRVHRLIGRAPVASAGEAGKQGRLRQLWQGVRFLSRVTWFRAKNRVGPFYLIMEMFGLLHEGSRFINVSDGGHIENLGLYSLLHRRCRLIIAVDGERDEPDPQRGFQFSGLATAIRHARIDFGVDVDIDLSRIGKQGGRHFAIGKIEYGSGFPDGWLVYIKSSLTGDENVYIRQYHAEKPQFPHESTSDQFFDETQFECYRALGYHAARDFLDRAATEFPEDMPDGELVANVYACQANEANGEVAANGANGTTGPRAEANPR
jgi:hypothetical protein